METRTAQAQRQPELHLRSNWAERLSAHFVPYAPHVPRGTSSPQEQESCVEETLADTAAKPQRKAVIPSKEVVWASTGPDGQLVPGFGRHKMMDGFILGLVRFRLGCSPLFNDFQHVHPSGLQVTTELQAWQTKTVFAAKNRKQPVQLICGADRWRGLVAAIRKLVKLPQFKDMD